MELIEGESLQEILQRNETLPLALTLEVVVQVARALGKAHEIGIVHRDIKPDNIFVTPSDDGVFCKVLDFGIAKQTQLPKMGGITNPGIMIGTPEYMSPEQVLSAKDVDFHADLWALAVTCYQLLSGVLPFHADTLGMLCVRLLEAKFTPVTKLRRDLPPAIDAWMERALHRDPQARFGSARELARALVAVVNPHATLDDDASTVSMLAVMGRSHAAELQAFQATIQSQSATLSGSTASKRSAVAAWRSPWSLALVALAALLIVSAGVVGVMKVVESDRSAAQVEPEAQSAAPPPAPATAGEESSEEDAEPLPEPTVAPSASGAAPSAEPSATPSAPTTRRLPPAPTLKAPAPSPTGKIRRGDHGF
jgi:serine/threonine-protein kinase